ncbi:MAG TPA: hypothetical protein VK815_02470 [Candidatus Acidoferrales bacterium]|jgi:hypothetical protein|nr:hypothetical protein [Candidatus Acidoferrales bacterium]
MNTSKIKLGYWLIGAYIAGPIFVTLVTLAICFLLGYQPDEAGSKSYFVLGFDIGGLLSGFSMIGIFSVITIPTGILALVLFRAYLRRKQV